MITICTTPKTLRHSQMRAIAAVALAFIIACSSLFTAGANQPAQLTKAEKKQLEKQKKIEQKRQAELLDSIAHENAVKAIDDSLFVMKCTKISFDPGNHLINSLNPELNFMYLNGTEAVVQTATNGTWSGYNGYGGFTLTGTASNIQKKVSKNGEVTLRFTIHGARGTALVELKLYKHSNQAYATINPPEIRGSLIMRGNITPLTTQVSVVNP